MGDAAAGALQAAGDVWPGWLGGVAIGVFTTLFLWATGRVLGLSSAYGEACGALGVGYFRRTDQGFGQRWRLWFAAGLPLGGAVAALLGAEGWSVQTSMGTLYESMLPAQDAARAAVLALGGACIGVGARMAGGCQSGHSIAGLALLNPPSLVASIGFFVGGIVMVQGLFALSGATL